MQGDIVHGQIKCQSKETKTKIESFCRLNTAIRAENNIHPEVKGVRFNKEAAL